MFIPGVESYNYLVNDINDTPYYMGLELEQRYNHMLEFNDACRNTESSVSTCRMLLQGFGDIESMASYLSNGGSIAALEHLFDARVYFRQDYIPGIEGLGSALANTWKFIKEQVKKVIEFIKRVLNIAPKTIKDVEQQAEEVAKKIEETEPSTFEIVSGAVSNGVDGAVKMLDGATGGIWSQIKAAAKSASISAGRKLRQTTGLGNLSPEEKALRAAIGKKSAEIDRLRKCRIPKYDKIKEFQKNVGKAAAFINGDILQVSNYKSQNAQVNQKKIKELQAVAQDIRNFETSVVKGSGGSVPAAELIKDKKNNSAYVALVIEVVDTIKSSDYEKKLSNIIATLARIENMQPGDLDDEHTSSMNVHKPRSFSEKYMNGAAKTVGKVVGGIKDRLDQQSSSSGLGRTGSSNGSGRSENNSSINNKQDKMGYGKSYKSLVAAKKEELAGGDTAAISANIRAVVNINTQLATAISTALNKSVSMCSRLVAIINEVTNITEAVETAQKELAAAYAAEDAAGNGADGEVAR